MKQTTKDKISMHTTRESGINVIGYDRHLKFEKPKCFVGEHKIQTAYQFVVGCFDWSVLIISIGLLLYFYSSAYSLLSILFDCSIPLSFDVPGR